MKYLSFLLCLITMTATAQNHNWVRTNPGGGGAYSTVGASASGIILAGSDLSGAYRSHDGGLTWDVIGALNGLTETHISGVGFHRIDGNILYIGTENGIFRSDDGGDHVDHVSFGGYITDIEFGTNNPNTGYATYHPTYDSNNGQVYKSIDNGLTWYQASTNLPAGIRILKLIVNPDNANIIYLLTGEGRFACGPAEVFRSMDGGITWTNLTLTLPAILDVALDPTNSNHLLLTTMNADCDEEYYWTNLEGDLYSSTNQGDSWGQPLSAHTGIIWISSSEANTIRLIDPREPYSWIDSAGTWTSTDGGNTFSQTGVVDDWDVFYNNDLFYCYSSSYNGICKTLGEDLSDNNNLFWVNYQWIFKTNNGGNTFENIFTDQQIQGETPTGFWRSRGFDNVNMMDVDISDANPDIVYAAYFDIGLWRSLDRGQSWQSCNTPSYSGDWDGHGGNCATVVADPTRAEVVWASMSGNQEGGSPTFLIKSANTGEASSWNVSNTGLPDSEIMGLSLDRLSDTENRTLYVTAAGDVYKSTDDGSTWTSILDCNGCQFTAIDYYDQDILYAGGEQGLWRSMDAGTSWTNVGHSDMAASSNTYFWDGDYDGVFDIQTDPNHPNMVWVTATGDNKGLYKSVDNGDTWSHVLTDDYMRKVGLSATQADIVYATSSSAFTAGGYDENAHGILFSTDGGTNWTPQNDHMAYPFALAVDVSNEDTPYVMVGSPGTGFQKSDVVLGLVNHEEIPPFMVQPNPTTDWISITIPDYRGNTYSINVYDENGKVVLRSTVTESQPSLSLKSLAAGKYYLVMTNLTGSKQQTSNIVKQ